ncbi:MAG: acetate--CoA ligase family protein [Microthrixaceae bacterium]
MTTLARLARGAGKGFDTLVFQAFVLPAGPSGDETAATAQRGRFAEIAAAVRRVPVPVVLQDPVSAPLSPLAREILHDENLVRVPGTELGLAAISHAVRWTARRAELLETGRSSPRQVAVDPSLIGRPLTEAEGLDLMEKAGVPVVPHIVVRSVDEAVAAASRLGGPVAMKISSVDVLHKSDIGGVVLGVTGADAVAAAYDQITTRVAERLPEARLGGVLVAPMRTGGVELVLGVNRDAVWGPVLLVGLGGVFVEVFGDVALRPLPLSRTEVLDMLAELRGAPLLKGARGSEPVDLESLVDAVLALADLAHALGDDYQSIEVNPLRADASGVEALDSLVEWNDNHADDQHGGEEA